MFWLNAELPPEIPAACVLHAADHYSVPAILLVSILKQEGGEVGRAYPRSHGTYFGPYQISDKWVPHLEKWGWTAELLQYDGCANTYAAAYILAYYQAREHDWPRAIARYNVGSLDTQKRVEAGTRYTHAVLKRWTKLKEKWTTNR